MTLSVPCLYLWLLAPVQIYHSRRRSGRIIPWTGINITKLVFGVLLAVVGFINLVIKIIISNEINPSALQVVESLITLISILLALFLMEFTRRHGHTASLILFIFWFLLSFAIIVGHVIIFRKIASQIPVTGNTYLQLIYFSISTPLILGELFLSAFKDTSLLDSQEITINGIVYKVNINVLQRKMNILPSLFFSWFDKYEVCTDYVLHPDDAVRNTFRGYQRIYSMQHEHSLKFSFSLREAVRTLFCLTRSHYKRMKYELAPMTSYEPSLWSTGFQLFIGDVLLGFFVFICSDLLLWSGPLFLGFIINLNSNAEGLICVTFFFILSLLHTLLRSQATLILTNTNLKMHSLYLSMAYKKILSLNSPKSIISLEQAYVRAQCLRGCLLHFAGLLTTPVQIFLQILILTMMLGYSAFIIIVLLVLINIAVSVASRKGEMTKELWASGPSSRNSLLISKGLLSVQMLKCYGWDGTFYHQIRSYYAHDKIYLKNLLTWNSIFANINVSIPVIMTLVILLICVYIIFPIPSMEPDIFYVTLAIIVVFRHHNTKISSHFRTTIEMFQSFRWISLFLRTPSLIEDTCVQDSNDNFAVRINSGRFTWSPEVPPALKNVNVELPIGQLAMVIGGPGAGKSSLLNCILGGMIRLRGKKTIQGRVIYVAENPWLRKGTIRENILFGHPPNDFYYDEVVKACHLTPVFQALEKKDLTLVQSKAISTDKKIQQQICLARAVFTNADIYLLDNFMRDLDVGTATNIFADIIGPKGLLGKKTRLFVVPSSSPFLKQADVIIHATKGKVAFINKETFEANDGPLKFDDCHSSSTAESTVSQQSDTAAEYQNIIINGACRSSAMKSCCYFCLGNISCLRIVVCCLILAAAYSLSFGIQLFVRSYLDSSKSSFSSFQSLIVGSFLLFVIISIVNGIKFKNFLSSAADKWHERTIATLLRLSRFTFAQLLSKYPTQQLASDLLMATGHFTIAIHYLIIIGAAIVVLFLLMCICVTPFILLFPFVLSFYILIQIFYSKIHGDTKKKCSQSEKPITEHFAETIAGLETIRVFQRQHEFLMELENYLDTSHAAHTIFLIGARWLVIRLDILNHLIVAFLGIIGITTSISPSNIGLAIVSALSLNHFMREIILAGCDIQGNSDAIARLHEIMHLPLEPPWKSFTPPSARWPENGAIAFRAFVCSRQKSLQLVLRGLTCDIRPGEKVGVVGSSTELVTIAHSLLRLTDALTGSIYIDGLDISQIGLCELRSRLTVITQDVMYLMPGTLWRNLDPKKQHLVEEVQVAVRISRMQGFVSSLPRGLMHEIDNDNPVLTDEIRLQICFARAILRQPKILVVDIDLLKQFPRVYHLIRGSLRCAFAHSTVLCLTTDKKLAESYDRVLVLENGTIKSFDTSSVMSVLETT